MRMHAALQPTRAGAVRLDAHRKQCALEAGAQGKALDVTHGADVEMCVMERREGT